MALLVLGWLAAPTAAAPPSAELCGPLETGGFGPWDYRKHRGQQLRLVEHGHFPREVELLIRGKSTVHVGGDINYTLSKFPNHHRALVSMTRLADRSKQDPPPYMKYTVECWFERAMRFAPDDVIVRVLYAQFLTAHKRTEEADQQLALAVAMAGQNPLTHYNIGLAYLVLGDHDKALRQAHSAMALGIQRTELKDALTKAGKWVDPEPSATPDTATQPASAADDPGAKE